MPSKRRSFFVIMIIAVMSTVTTIQAIAGSKPILLWNNSGSVATDFHIILSSWVDPAKYKHSVSAFSSNNPPTEKKLQDGTFELSWAGGNVNSQGNMWLYDVTIADKNRVLPGNKGVSTILDWFWTDKDKRIDVPVGMGDKSSVFLDDLAKQGKGLFLGVPGPIAGAGLPALLGLLGFTAWRRRQPAA